MWMAIGCATVSPVRAESTITWDRPITGLSGPRGGLQLPDGGILGVRHISRHGRRLFVTMKSTDAGRTWTEHATIASDTPGTDIGDGHLLRLRDGRLWCSLRRNKLPRSYAIEIAESVDDGATWRRHSVVDTSNVPDEITLAPHTRGLWASFLLQRSDGTVQCYYDDERTPADAGLPGHQWVTMRTWDPLRKAWINPVVVSRAPDRALSRDGMPSVVELLDGRLLATVESVRTRPPHANLVRSVFSEDGGATWSWQERRDVYRPPGNFMALAPWTIRTRDGLLICVFCTDQDRDVPDTGGTPPWRLNMDVKYVLSRDDGKTWSAPRVVYDEQHRNYLPGTIQLTDNSLLVQWRNFAAGSYMTRRGELKPPR